MSHCAFVKIKYPLEINCEVEVVLAGCAAARPGRRNASTATLAAPRPVLRLTLLFSQISPDETNYFHVTSFDGRPDETLRRVVGKVDNALRNTVSKIVKAGRGEKETNQLKD
jgi:hypothetical protein